MNNSPLITGHNHFQPSAPAAPLEFDFTPGDAELVATCAAAVDALRAKNGTAPTNVAVSDLEAELEAQGFTFVEVT